MQGQPTDFWAKLERAEGDDGSIIAWHPLEAHCADVAAMLEALLEQTILGRRLGFLIGQDRLTTVQIQRLAVLAALHDAGKVNHGFQRKATIERGDRAGHVSPLIDALDAAHHSEPEEMGAALGLGEIYTWFADEDSCFAFLLATWGHHGYPVAPQKQFKPALWRPSGQGNPIEGLARLAAYTRLWFPEAYASTVASFPSTPAFQHAFNGVLTLADWMGSDATLFEFAELEQDRIKYARAQARNALVKLGLDTTEARGQLASTVLTFERVSDFAPHPIQAAVLEIPVDDDGGLVILESDTGSGKTEAALAYFLRLFQAGLVDGMYVALPTRTSATQIFRRVVQTIERAFPDLTTRPPVVQAVPGYLNVDDVEGVKLAHFKVLWNDDDKERWRHRGWAAEGPKRYLAGAIAIGTIDQVLLSALMVGHAHMRSAALLRHLLIVDEVHASDAYMGRILDAVLDNHLAAGGYAFLMSATLGSAARTRFTSKMGGEAPTLEEAKGIDYPLITYSSGKRQAPNARHAKATTYEKTVHLETSSIAADPSAIAEHAAFAARAGARVLIIRNTVKGCVDVQIALEEAVGADRHLLFGVGDRKAPHHSRYAGQDRRRLDVAIEEAFGRKSQRSGIVAVATQTVEQSLDLDADLLLTDLCPVDVLLQRMGRLHRHPNRVRPVGFERACTIVLVPKERSLEGLIRKDGKAPGPHGLGTVYEDLRILEATWRQIEQSPVWVIPRMNRELVEMATHPSALELVMESEAWHAHGLAVSGAALAKKSIAYLNIIDRDKAFGEQCFSREVNEKIGTRLGEDDRIARFALPFDSPLGGTVVDIKIPAHLVRGSSDDDEPRHVSTHDQTTRFEFAGQPFIYDRFGLRKID